MKFLESKLLSRLIILESKVELLENELHSLKEFNEKIINDKADQLEGKIIEKCYCRVYDRPALIKLLDLVGKQGKENNENNNRN